MPNSPTTTKPTPHTAIVETTFNTVSAEHLNRPIFIIDDDPLIADCIRLAAERGLVNLQKTSRNGAHFPTKAPIEGLSEDFSDDNFGHKKPEQQGRKQRSEQAISHKTPLPDIKIFSDAIAAIDATSSQIPALIFLDVLLTGPNGFTMLNELASYPETADIPIILVSSLDLSNYPLKHYNIVQVLSKETMLPTEIAALVEKFYV